MTPSPCLEAEQRAMRAKTRGGKNQHSEDAVILKG